MCSFDPRGILRSISSTLQCLFGLGSNGKDCAELDWNGLDWLGPGRRGADRFGANWIRLARNGQVGVERTGLDWFGVERNGLDRSELDRI